MKNNIKLLLGYLRFIWTRFLRPTLKVSIYLYLYVRDASHYILYSVAALINIKQNAMCIKYSKERSARVKF
jgi:hypothetical protein